MEKATALEIQTAGQKYLGNGLDYFIVLMNMFVPLPGSYLPAPPGLEGLLRQRHRPDKYDASVFYVFHAIGILLWGPISDKYGRRPVIALG